MADPYGELMTQYSSIFGQHIWEPKQARRLLPKDIHLVQWMTRKRGWSMVHALRSTQREAESSGVGGTWCGRQVPIWSERTRIEAHTIPGHYMAHASAVCVRCDVTQRKLVEADYEMACLSEIAIECSLCREQMREYEGTLIPIKQRSEWSVVKGLNPWM